MDSFVTDPAIWTAVAFLLVAGAALAVLLLRSRGERRGELRRIITLLRATDPNTRIQTLEKTQALPPPKRGALARMLRSELAAASRGGRQSSQQVITIWFIRQVLALLGDSRPVVRTDAARVLGAVMGGGGAQLAGDKNEPIALSPGVAGAVELAGGRVLTQSEDMRSETRVLALAEMLEAGLRPLAIGMRALEGVEDEAMEPLSSALRDRSPRVRRSLVDVLAAMGGERSIEMLVPLLQDPSPDLRAQAARALGNLRAETAASQLTDLMRDPIDGVRAAAAAALAEMEMKSACGSVIAALGDESRREESSERARGAMIDAIVRLSDGAREDMEQALKTLPRPVARSLAAALEAGGVVERWLTQTEWKGAADVLPGLLASLADLGVSRPLLEALDSTAEWVRIQSAAALGHSREPGSLAAVAALLSDPDEKVRAEAVKSVARQGEPAALGPLATAVADPDGAVRLAAVTGLAGVLAGRSGWRVDLLPGDVDVQAALRESQRALLHAAAEAQPEVRAEAATALGLLSSAEAADALADLALADGEERVREAAAEALGQCGFPQKRRLLAGALEAEDDSRRARATAMLGALGGPEVGKQLVEALDDRSPGVRQAALKALSRVDVSGLGDGLRPHLKSADAGVRAEVAAHLGRGRSLESADALVQALSDPDEDVRVAALAALGGMGRAVRRHQGAITARRSDPSPRVREGATAALSQLRGAWSDTAEVAELFRQGPLSPAGAETIVDMAVTGDLDPLLRALGQDQSDRAIAEHLAGAGRETLPAVLAALHRLPDQEQTRAAISIGQALRRGVPAQPFVEELKALDSDVRLMAVEIAGQLDTPEAAAALIQVLERDPVADVRSRAASLLGDASGDDAAKALERARRDDPNNVVRRVAGRALDRGRETEEPSIFSPPSEREVEADTAEGGSAGGA